MMVFMVAKVKIGDQAPNFTAKAVGLNNKDNLTLSDYRGKIVVLYFYPKAFTPGCTKEACSFRDIYADFQNKNVEVIGVSVDTEDKQQSFLSKYKLPFPLISDVDKHVSNKYVGLGLGGYSNRVTFLIDPNGIIRHIWDIKLHQYLFLGRHPTKVEDEITKLKTEFSFN